MRYIWLLVCVMGMSVIGCRSYGPWHPAQEDSPWVSAGRQATTMWRSVDPPPFVVAALGNQTVWIDSRGERLSPGKVSKKAEEFLASNGGSLKWQHTGRYVQGTEQLLAPYQLTLVSICPSVIVMTPCNYELAAGRSTHEPPIPVPSRQYLSWYYTQPYPSNVLWYGTRVPWAQDMLWFSADLGQTPVPVTVRDEGAEIHIGTEKLLFVREGNCWKVTRAALARSPLPSRK